MDRNEVHNQDENLHSAMAEAVGALGVDPKPTAHTTAFQSLERKPLPLKKTKRLIRPKKPLPKASVLVPLMLISFILGFGGAYFINQKGSTTADNSFLTSHTKLPAKTKTNPIYNGWDAYCKPDAGTCIRYPSDWTANEIEGFENSSQTAFVTMSLAATKDRSTGVGYIASISDLTIPNPNLKVLGVVVGNRPTYAIYDTAYIKQNDLKVGDTKPILIGAYTFTNNSGALMDVVGTPDAAGYAAISDSASAQAWFKSANGQLVLKAVQSFYYQ